MNNNTSINKPEKFYTAERKSVLQSEVNHSNKSPMFQSTGLMILDMLEEQQNTLQNIECILQRIEQLFSAEKQEECIYNAVSHAMMGNKYKTTPKDV